MKTFYSDDKTTQIVLSLLKAHGIRKVIVSPGTTNIALVGSMQYDSFFELYSSVDERSAAYMACGLAYESGEAVVLSCTEATASRNYFPGLTEAYYRKLPILAITGTHGSYEVGHLKPQVINRSIAPLDTVRLSVDLGKCKDENDEWSINTKANMAILELTRKGGGPAHINLAFSCNSYNTKELPVTRVIRRYSMGDDLPNLPEGRIAIFVGSHKLWTKEELMTIDAFCANHNAVILCDKTSGYIGKYRIDYSLVAAQMLYSSSTSRPDLLIHIGEVSGDTYTQSRLKPKVTWRVNTDGDIKDTFRSLNNVFDMPEKSFFTYYANKNIDKKEEYFQVCQNEYDLIASRIPEVAFSNIWIAQRLANKIPAGSYVHLGIFNSLRSWNFVQLPSNIYSICNVGGFGIDGTLSTVLGASLTYPQKLHFVILGDLAFFYDMNSLGNRYIGNNIRVLLINNGLGIEFRKYDHPCAKFGENAEPYMAAAGHFGCQSRTLVKDYISNLGFEYLTASSKEEFLDVYKKFIDPQMMSIPVVFEVFTNSKDESDAVNDFRHIVREHILELKSKMKSFAKYIVKR
ncbi:thiamine pyrophosphate-binding protein [Bacteroides cellulosilyticus]|uniref:thiamine pyrophosphate-binding protein n=1 Tax=Bacteroides cellulosilyticus TaxID=246787 RepID=UPI0022E39A83|nr:thiamine pyrophosphate-binding protein [Bacteroides cellulosilyticus]